MAAGLTPSPDEDDNQKHLGPSYSGRVVGEASLPLPKRTLATQMDTHSPCLTSTTDTCYKTCYDSTFSEEDTNISSSESTLRSLSCVECWDDKGQTSYSSCSPCSISVFVDKSLTKSDSATDEHCLCAECLDSPPVCGATSIDVDIEPVLQTKPKKLVGPIFKLDEVERRKQQVNERSDTVPKTDSLKDVCHESPKLSLNEVISATSDLECLTINDNDCKDECVNKDSENICCDLPKSETTVEPRLLDLTKLSEVPSCSSDTKETY